MSLFKRKTNSQENPVALQKMLDPTRSQPIKIEITLSNGASQTFRFGTKVVMACVVLTVVSALWGSFTAWWIAWEKLHGTDTLRQEKHTRMLVDQITQKLDLNRTNQRSERVLLTQIRDRLDRIWKTTDISNNEKATSPKPSNTLSVENPFAKRLKVEFPRSLAYEKRIQAGIKSNPTTVYPVKNFRSDLPVGVESIAHFSLKNSDVIRVGLTSLNATDLIPGEIRSLIKYEVDGVEIIVACCSLASLGSNINEPELTTVLFNFRKNVKKFMEVVRPQGNLVRIKEVKIGIASGTERQLLYSRWLKGTCLTDCIHHAEPDIPSINLDSPRVSQNQNFPVDTH